MDLDGLVSAKEAQAAMPNVSLSLMWSWRKQGRLEVRAYRTRRGEVIPAEDVDVPDPTWVKLSRYGDYIAAERDTKRNDPAGQRRTRAA